MPSVIYQAREQNPLSEFIGGQERTAGEEVCRKKGVGMGGVCFSGSPPTFKHSYRGLLSYTRDPHRLRDHNRHEIRRM